MQELHFLDPGVGLWEMLLGRPSMEGTEQPADSTPAPSLGVRQGRRLSRSYQCLLGCVSLEFQVLASAAPTFGKL